MGDIMTTILSRLPIDLSRQTLNTPIAVTVTAALALLVAVRLYRTQELTPKLIGPPSKSFWFGVTQEILTTHDLGTLYADWEKKYGLVYEVPSSLGSRMLMLGDPKGIAHFFANDTTTYQQLSFAKVFSRRFFGDILLIQEGEAHKRQRRAISSGFSIAAIRNLLPIFLDSANRLTSEWNTLSESDPGSFTTDVQKWMNYVSLDSVGTGAFSHEFQSLAGKRSPVMEAFDSFGSLRPSLDTIILFAVGPLFPRLVMKLPNQRAKAIRALSNGVKDIAKNLLEKDADGASRIMDKSILGALIKSETASSSVHMSLEEIEAQQLLMIAGYETTAITLTWALIELARNPDIQKNLRAELEEHITAGEEVSYDKLMNGLPYLDAFVSEILRLHPAGPEVMRQLSQDDTIPLGQPITTASGVVIDSLPVSKGTIIRVPIIGVNRSETLWGPDATKFDPSRWLEERPGEFNKRKEEIHGYKHLMSFGHGPRVCLGRVFALTETKAVLSVIVRKFEFEFPGGPETKIGSHRSINPRPKVLDQEGPKVPLVVKKIVE